MLLCPAIFSIPDKPVKESVLDTGAFLCSYSHLKLHHGAFIHGGSTCIHVRSFHSGHNSIVYTQMDNVLCTACMHTCTCAHAHVTLCFSVHGSVMFTMATSPERCPVEGGDRIREGWVRGG